MLHYQQIQHSFKTRTIVCSDQHTVIYSNKNATCTTTQYQQLNSPIFNYFQMAVQYIHAQQNVKWHWLLHTSKYSTNSFLCVANERILLQHRLVVGMGFSWHGCCCYYHFVTHIGADSLPSKDATFCLSHFQLCFWAESSRTKTSIKVFWKCSESVIYFYIVQLNK